MIKSTIIPNNRQATKELDRKYIAEIHQKQAEFTKNRKHYPSPSAYNPVHQYRYFDRSLQNLNLKGELKDQSNKPHADFTKAERFKHYLNKKKDQKEEKVKTAPGPGSYNLMVNWPGKVDPKKKDDVKMRSYDKAITKGLTKSIYY